MTFLEAAIEILRREGKPLPVRRLAELAVQHNLLSVVGRDPEGTMQARLAEVLDKGPTHGELLRVERDLFGLRSYPPRPYPPPRETAAGEAEGADAEGDAGGDGGDEPIAAAGPGAPGGRRRRRRGRGGNRGQEAGNGTHTNGASQDTEHALPPLVAAEPLLSPMEEALSVEAGPMSEDGGGSDGETDADAEEFDVEASGDSAPLMVAAAGDEELTRSGDEREVRPEIMGRREERGRHRGRGPKDNGRDHQRDVMKEHPRRPEQDRGPRRDQLPQHRGSAAPIATAPASSAPASSMPAAPIPAAAARGNGKHLGNELYELLRAQDGRPQHVRALAQEVDRKKILEGRPQPEITREVRMALHRETSARPSKGLRPRVRSLGGGNYTIAERKLDEDVVAAERALEVALEKLAQVTSQSIRRRLTRCSPFSFEQLGRSCAEALAVEQPTLVRRGEGVAYYGGERTIGSHRSRVLIAIRPGEGELGRRAIGELRAGLDARGFDEGILFSLGRLSAEGREELVAGRAVTVFDGDSIAAFLIEHKLGVRTSHAPVTYFDAEFFAELNET